jgi:hypothetical protein
MSQRKEDTLIKALLIVFLIAIAWGLWEIAKMDPHNFLHAMVTFIAFKVGRHFGIKKGKQVNGSAVPEAEAKETQA